MGHEHSVHDSDARFSIDPVTRMIKNESKKKLSLIQGDHNSEIFSFTCPRYIEFHDMSLCNKVEVHYFNYDAQTNKFNSGIYEADDLQVGEDDNSVVFSWTISGNGTQHQGRLEFLIRFKCEKDGIVTYAWNTAFFTEANVGKGSNADSLFEKEYVDIIEQWKKSVVQGFADDLVIEAKKAVDVYAEQWTSGLANANKQIGFLSNYVTPEMFGAKGDGVTDDTEAIKKAFCSGSRFILLNNDYRITDSLEIKSNTTIIFNGIIHADKNKNKEYYSAITLEEVENVRLYNPHLECDYDITTEWSHGIMLNRTKNVLLHNVVCKRFADGVCISYSLENDSYNDDLYIDSIVTEKCKRNSVTVECCKNAYIGRVIGIETAGFSPETCVDIEHDKSGLIIDNLTIDNIYSYKCSGGVRFILDGYSKAKVNRIDIVDGAFMYTGGISEVTVNELHCVYSDSVFDFKIMDNADVGLSTKLTLKDVSFESKNAKQVEFLLYVKCNSNTFVDIEEVKVNNITPNYLYYIDNYTNEDDYEAHCRLFGIDGIGNKVTKRASVKWLNVFSSVFENEIYSYSPVLLVNSELTKIRNYWQGSEVTFEIIDNGSIVIPSCSNFKPTKTLNTEGDRIKVAFENNDSDSKAIWKVKNCFLLTT